MLSDVLMSGSQEEENACSYRKRAMSAGNIHEMR